MHSLALILAFLFTISCSTKHPAQATQETMAHADAEEEEHSHGHHEAETVTSMAGSHAHLGPHFRWTTLRPSNDRDQATATAILRQLREALAPYRDYRVAIKDGYEPSFRTSNSRIITLRASGADSKQPSASILSSQPRCSTRRRPVAMNWKGRCSRPQNGRARRI